MIFIFFYPPIECIVPMAIVMDIEIEPNEFGNAKTKLETRVIPFMGQFNGVAEQTAPAHIGSFVEKFDLVLK